ncbi:phosphatase [Rhizobium dioscoreae]|uniref:metallophosphoesterase n=1 Tax=Rhizobium dioscoreae TaxID=2653122 RepID=UPI001260EDF3|nr:metallophosphoesterase [Rhizobium dioscoreae]GES41743.1 phosphatase [Rhizobium dioscoreae]
MKAWIASDLHLEFGGIRFLTVPPEADIMICAGDILNKGIVPSIEWLAANVLPKMPVVFVAGNHETYGAALIESIDRARETAARHPGFYYLENDSAIIGGVLFLGTTLWTDYRLLGSDPILAMAAAESGMNDYRKIKWSRNPYRRLKPIHLYRKHVEATSFLDGALAVAQDRKVVVVTHHAPSWRSLSPRFIGDPLSPCYASNLDDMIAAHGPDLWVHGHLHNQSDYIIARTRVVCNPRGYPGEHTGYDPQMVVEIG